MGIHQRCIIVTSALGVFCVTLELLSEREREKHYWRRVSEGVVVHPFISSGPDRRHPRKALTMDDDNESNDRPDEIVNDLISLIHTTTHSSFVTCSQLSAKLISYLSQVQIANNQWQDLEKAVEVNDRIWPSFDGRATPVVSF